MTGATITTRDAWRAAEDWVRAEAAPIAEFVGALVAGSTRARDPGAPHPVGSDVDVWVVVDAPVPDFMHDPRHRFAVRKFRRGEVILERGFKPWGALADAEVVLGDPHLAPNLAAPVILADPSGRLARLAAAVGTAFPRRSHALRRVDAKLANAERFCGYAASGATPLVREATMLAVTAAWREETKAVAMSPARSALFWTKAERRPEGITVMGVLSCGERTVAG